ncbi:MAG: NTP transferase domain-containing protein [Thermodesulfovibrionia bacterium]
MKCLIIAAGKGSRLSKKGGSKPLLPLMGLSIIERVILTAARCGIEDFYVVTGYNGKKVRLFLDELGQRRNIKITHIINDDWRKGNGTSVLKAKETLKENFILLMGDHIFDEDILRRLKDEKIQKGEVILATDFKTDSNSFVDINDVTKVSVNNNKITDIGKNITQYNAYDTGIFLCSPAIFTAMETSIIRCNNDSLSGGIKILVREGKVKSFDVEENFWIDIDDERTFQKAEKCLIDRLKKPTDGPVARYLNRPISAKITRYLLKTDISPNQISFFSFILSLIAAALFFFGSYIALAAGAVFAQISSIIDGCDGEVARLKHKETDFGGWFDAVLDRYADAFLLFGLTYHTFTQSGNISYLVIGFLAIIGSFMNSYTSDKYDGFMKRKLGPGKHYFRMGRDVRIFLIFIGALFNRPLLVLVVIAFLMNIENIRRVKVLYKNG